MTKRLLLSALLLLSPFSLMAAETPAKAYMAYHEALRSGLSESALWPHATPAARAEFEGKFPEELRGRVFYMMKTSAPAQVRVVHEAVQGEEATLTVKPTDSGKRLVGKASLKRIGGEWKVEKVVWQQE